MSIIKVKMTSCTASYMLALYIKLLIHVQVISKGGKKVKASSPSNYWIVQSWRDIVHVTSRKDLRVIFVNIAECLLCIYRSQFKTLDVGMTHVTGFMTTAAPKVKHFLTYWYICSLWPSIEQSDTLRLLTNIIFNDYSKSGLVQKFCWVCWTLYPHEVTYVVTV